MGRVWSRDSLAFGIVPLPIAELEAQFLRRPISKAFPFLVSELPECMAIVRMSALAPHSMAPLASAFVG